MSKGVLQNECNTPEIICHPERLEKIKDFRKKSKYLRTNLTAKALSVRRSFDLLRSLRMTYLVELSH